MSPHVPTMVRVCINLLPKTQIWGIAFALFIPYNVATTAKPTKTREIDKIWQNSLPLMTYAVFTNHKGVNEMNEDLKELLTLLLSFGDPNKMVKAAAPIIFDCHQQDGLRPKQNACVPAEAPQTP